MVFIIKGYVYVFVNCFVEVLRNIKIRGWLCEIVIICIKIGRRIIVDSSIVGIGYIK